jgi:L-fuculose-phosphate aldolase
MLLANHGAVTLGRTLEEAWIRMETLEHSARILLGARLLGRVTELTPDVVARLDALRASV